MINIFRRKARAYLISYLFIDKNDSWGFSNMTFDTHYEPSHMDLSVKGEIHNKIMKNEIYKSMTILAISRIKSTKKYL